MAWSVDLVHLDEGGVGGPLGDPFADDVRFPVGQRASDPASSPLTWPTASSTPAPPYRDGSPSRRDVVYAKNLSGGARSWLSERQIGWVDETGRANLLLESGLVIVREAAPTEKHRVARDRWTNTMVAAAEAVLAGVPPIVGAVEAKTGMSRGASANALARLEQRGLLERPTLKRGPHAARQVVDMDPFIDQYAQAAAELRKKQKMVRFHRLWADRSGGVHPPRPLAQ